MYKVVSLHFTNDCNFNCHFCYRDKGTDMMEKELFLGLPRHIKDFSDQIALGGGEPSLYPDLVGQFAQECRDYDLTCNLTTNGYLIKDWKDEKIEHFCKDLTMISVSLDYSKFEHWKNSNEFLDTCKRLKKYSLVGCNLLIDHDLMRGVNLIKMADCLFERGLDQVFSLYPKNIWGPDILEKKHYYEFLTTKYSDFYVDDLTFKILDEGKYGNWRRPCHYGKDIISINEKGRVSGCSLSDDYKLIIEKPKDILKMVDVSFEDRYCCPYLRR